MTEFTPEESQLLGRLFPNGLLTKIGVVIRDAVVGVVCKELGIEKLNDLNLKIESASNAVPARVSAEVDAKICDPATVTTIVRRIIDNESARVELERALHETGAKTVRRIETERMGKLTTIVADFYADRDPDGERPSDKAIEGLAQQLYNAGTIKGLRDHQFRNVVAEAIPTMEAQMTELVSGLCKARTSKQLIESVAAQMVAEGQPCEPAMIRARLEREEDIASRLK